MSERGNRNDRRKATRVASTFGEKVLDALADFTDALEKGEVTQRLTCRQIKLNLHPKEYSPEMVRQTRELLGISQALFAKFLGVSPKTVQGWEHGINSPNRMACRFMDEIRRTPDHWADRLKQATVTRPVPVGRRGGR